MNKDMVIVEHSFTSNSDHELTLFQKTDDILKKTGLELENIDMFAMGLGPGSYTGLRISLAAAIAFAMPDNSICYGVSSALALAYQVFLKHKTSSVTVLGDARRRKVWAHNFKFPNGIKNYFEERSLLTSDDIVSGIDPLSVVVSSEPERLTEQYNALRGVDICVIEQPLFPLAGDIGRIAAFSHKLNIPSPPLQPIYAHPAI